MHAKSAQYQLMFYFHPFRSCNAELCGIVHEKSCVEFMGFVLICNAKYLIFLYWVAMEYNMEADNVNLHQGSLCNFNQ